MSDKPANGPPANGPSANGPPADMPAKSRNRPWGRDRKARVSVRLSDDEKRAVEARAGAAGLTLSAFLRQAALGERGLGAARQASSHVIRHRLRRVHTCLQQASLHQPGGACAAHLRQATALLTETIDSL